VGGPRYDFSHRRVVVTGGTRGLGLEVARCFAETGAEVVVTGTSSAVSYYDPAVATFGYEQVDLTDGDEIAALAERLGPVDVLVNAAAPRLSTVVDEAEREFLAHAARLTLLGPLQLATRLRHRMATSDRPGGGSVVNLPVTRGWFAMSESAARGEADTELERVTRRLGSSWGRLGVRVNTVTSPLSVPSQRSPDEGSPDQGSPDEGSPDQHSPDQHSGVEVRTERGAGPLLTRAADTRTAVQQQIVDLTLFLASSGAAGLSGQTLPVGLTVRG
jgi:3-oxoacyl-[acyl-carrier protein] reductase